MTTWQRVGEEVRARRLELNLTQEQAAAASGGRISSANWRKIERGDGERSQIGTRLGVTGVLGWEDLAFEQILTGERPTLKRPNVAQLSADDRLTLVEAGIDELKAGVAEILRRLADDEEPRRAPSSPRPEPTRQQ